MIRQKVHLIETLDAESLTEEINEFNETHNTFATQIFPLGDELYWTAFIHYREVQE